MKFEITKYYSTFCTFQINATNEKEAYQLVNKLSIDENQILSNLEDWCDADEIRKISDSSENK